FDRHAAGKRGEANRRGRDEGDRQDDEYPGSHGRNFRLIVSRGILARGRSQGNERIADTSPKRKRGRIAVLRSLARASGWYRIDCFRFMNHASPTPRSSWRRASRGG